jgi:hypothetical protein
MMMMTMQTKPFSDPCPNVYTPRACRIIAITTEFIYSFVYVFIRSLPGVTLIKPTYNNRVNTEWVNIYTLKWDTRGKLPLGSAGQVFFEVQHFYLWPEYSQGTHINRYKCYCHAIKATCVHVRCLVGKSTCPDKILSLWLRYWYFVLKGNTLLIKPLT